MRTAVLASAVSALALSFAAAGTASAATTYNVVTDFNATTNAGVFTYGWDDHTNPDPGFQLFQNHSSDCITAGMSCWQSTDPQFFVPLVAKNTSGSTLVYANTVVQPTDVLNLHPGADGNAPGGVTGGADIDVIVRFTAPKQGTYNFSGFFEALDTNPTGVTIHAGSTLVPISGSANIGALTVGAPTDFDFNIFLHPADTVDFVVNRRNPLTGSDSFGNDSTGLALTVSVPEPATWGLMIMGFGGMGAVLRSNRRRAIAAAA